MLPDPIRAQDLILLIASRATDAGGLERRDEPLGIEENVFVN
jgi:hypothetical protein